MSENCTWSSTRRHEVFKVHNQLGGTDYSSSSKERECLRGGTGQGVGHDICIAMSVHFYFATHWWLHCTVFLLFIFLPFLPPRMFVGDVGGLCRWACRGVLLCSTIYSTAYATRGRQSCPPTGDPRKRERTASRQQKEGLSANAVYLSTKLLSKEKRGEEA